MMICSPPSRKKSIRPYLSTTKMEIMIKDKFMTPRITADKPKIYNLEENWNIKCHDIDARELLNERNGESHEGLRSVFPSHNFVERMLYPLGNLGSLDQVLKLLLDI